MKTRQDELEEWGTEVIFGRAHGFKATMMRALLRCFSWLFRLVIMLRLKLYAKRMQKSHQLGVLVISVGNITMGGTGKTPVVESLARALSEHNRKVAILTRGYKSEALDEEQFWVDYTGNIVRNLPKISSDGETRLLGPLHSGDEPYMLAKNLDGVAVLVDPNRIKSGIFAIEQLECDTLILDDGMQYLALKHEIDIVLVDCGAPFGTGAMMPRGTLREPKSSLARASYIILTKSEGKPQDELIAKIRRYNHKADIIVTNHSPKYLENISTGEREPLEFLKDKWVACLSGIARPESFENSVRQLGAKVEICRRFPDHYWFEEGEIDQFVERCAERAMELIVTTEKDAVRFFNPQELEVPIYFLRIEIDIIEGQEYWDRCIERICNLNTKLPVHEWGKNI